jgi:putative oxidoreductase
MAGGKIGGKDIGLLVLRLTLGGILIAHGVRHLQEGVSGFADALGSLGLPYPYPLAVAVIAAQIGGGALLVLGLAAAVGALAAAAILILAIVKVHWKNGFYLQETASMPGQIAHGFEFALACLGMALCILFAGPGSITFKLWGKKEG